MPRLDFALVVAFVWALAGCVHGSFHRTVQQPSARTDVLLVMVAGRGDDAHAFEREGFVAALRLAGSDADVVLAEPPRSLLRQRQFTSDLHHDVVLPARRAGYRRIYIAGVSQGGFAVLSYVRDHGRSIEGAIVIAPFLGPQFYIEDMQRQGGLSRWSPEQVSKWWTATSDMWPVAHDIEVLWEWIQRGGARDSVLHLAWGRHDEVVPGVELLAASLPPERRLAIGGGHEWPTWERLWVEFLRRDPYDLTSR